MLDLTIQAYKVYCALLAALVGFYFKREPFSDSGMFPVSWECGNVNEYLRTPLSGGDKPKTPVIVPFF